MIEILSIPLVILAILISIYLIIAKKKLKELEKELEDFNK
jgi:hypothetical protein